MKKLGLAIAAAAIVAFAGSAMADPPPEGYKGNGLPKISMQDAWQMNVHAYASCPSGDFDGSNRRTVVVQSTNVAEANAAHGAGNKDTSDYNDIWLLPVGADEWRIPDGNACDYGIDDDGNDIGAVVELPLLVAYEYDVFIKFRGAPYTQLDPVLCGVDEFDNTYCNTGSSIQTRSSGQDKYKNYTRILLGFDDPDDFCTGNVCDLFDPGLEGYFWDWSASDGAKATLVFVPCTTAKTGDDPSLTPCWN